LVPKSKILAFSLHSSEEYVVKMARCGARGYVTKDQPASELLKAIKCVFQGGLQFPVGTSDALFSPSFKVSKRPTGTGALVGGAGSKNKKHKLAP
ncbi:MAG: hypothetical protein Q7R35_07490, partial [Elusimicrobiota bacterium]|nr:hypothetical protein [Elusimicrobiota bacterium]